MITAEQFKAATGFDPQDDDLERCNCKHVGEIGHIFCGWDRHRNLPWYIAAALDLADGSRSMVN